MIELTYIARPLIGAVIGYITNDIAIRMLFRPRRAKYIFGFRLPFTPGLIPKEKARIAASIGEAVSKNLMNREVLEKTLLSDDITGKLAAAFDDFVAGLKTNTEPVGQLLARYLAPADTEALRSEIVSSLADRINHAVVAADLGPEIASMAIGHVADKLRGGVPGILGADKLVATLIGPIEKLLAKHISEMVEANSRQMAASLIDEQTAAFMDMPVNSLVDRHQRHIAFVRGRLLSVYRRAVAEQLPKAMEAVDISNMIEQRINEMDVQQTEQLILQVMRKELKAIIWLGALLGFIMGCLNLLF
mgnify:FL=1